MSTAPAGRLRQNPTVASIASKSNAILRLVVGRLLTRTTWTEPLYIAAALPVAIFGFGLVVAMFFCVLASFTLVGLPLIAVVLMMSIWVGFLHRRLVRGLLGVRVDGAKPRPRGQGFFGWLQSVLGDLNRWRAWAYLVWKGPYALICACALVFTWGYAVLAMSYPLLRSSAWPHVVQGDGTSARGVSVGHVHLVSWPQVLLVFVVGVAWLIASPWIVHGLVVIDRWVMRQLLGSPTSARLRELEGARAFAMDDAATTLRRIERDLHDGAQAKMVAVALAVGMARDNLEESNDSLDVEKTRELLENAHARAKEAIVELRDLARGIHPAVLDAGLETALATLVSGSPIPVMFSFTMAERPSPAIETIGYFCAAELLTNVAKHAAARHIYLDVMRHGNQVRLRVIDDGCGGADVAQGTGLRGLTERVRAVDGTLELSSPVGGPTVVVVDLPFDV
jgi:signal transduction histidine kinase